jgi:hypothetical protein
MAGFANDIVYANNGDFSIAGSNKGTASKWTSDKWPVLDWNNSG